MIGEQGWWGRKPSGYMNIIRGTKVKSETPIKDHHKTKFYENAAEEYEICSRCPYPKCKVICNPYAVKKKLEQQEEIQRLMNEGHKATEVAEMVGCSKSRVEQVWHGRALEDPCENCYSKKRGLCKSGTCQSKRNWEKRHA